MPIISQFYGIIITMHFRENERHNLPHIHAEYSNFDAVFDFETNLISGKMPLKQKKMIQAWILIHNEELQSLWNLMNNKKEGWFKIEPLK